MKPVRHLAGLAWRVYSPSLYQLAHADATIAYDGRAWLIAVHGVYGTREFASRDDAAALIATAFTAAEIGSSA